MPKSTSISLTTGRLLGPSTRTGPEESSEFCLPREDSRETKFYTLPSCHATLRREGITMLARVNTALIVQFKNHNWSNPFLAH